MESAKFSEEMLSQLKDISVKFINTFDIRVLGYKNLLSKMNHPMIPKTWILNDSLVDFAVSHRTELVLKPSNLFE